MRKETEVTDLVGYAHYSECYDNQEYCKLRTYVLDRVGGDSEKTNEIMNVLIDACLEQSGVSYFRGSTSSILQWASWAFTGLTFMAFRDYVLSFGNFEWQTLFISVGRK